MPLSSARKTGANALIPPVAAADERLKRRSVRVLEVARIDAERAWTVLRDPRRCVRSRTAIAHDVYSASQFVLRRARRVDSGPDRF
jgi:hypothetical protein